MKIPIKKWAGYLLKSFIWSFSIIEWVLRDRLDYFYETGQDKKQNTAILRLLFVSVVAFHLVGFVGGLSGRDFFQAFYSAIKLPYLFLICGLICLPTCYYFGLLFGSRLHIKQIITIILTSQAVTATLALSLTPISILFLLSGTNSQTMVILNCCGLGLVTFLGVVFLIQGLLVAQQPEPVLTANVFTWLVMFAAGGFRSIFFLLWLVVYGLVGAQLSWTLRPFLGIPFNEIGFWNSLLEMFQ
ncbi:MAG: hypothetical protein JXA42_25245 [Anaerolineales bacterium]|nr:hypothetical protein [Anaerolineales bacterium]